MTGTQYSLEQYPHHRNENIRYNDTDRQGHVNNAVFSTFFESSRVSILYDADRGLAKGETEFVIVTFEVEYLKELHWPGEVTIGTRIGRVGRSSLVFEQALFQQGECVSVAKSTMVMINKSTRQSTPLSEAALNALSDLKL